MGNHNQTTSMRQLKITPSITKRDSGVTTQYLNEVSKQQMVTKDEEVDLAKRIKAGDEKALDTLVRANLRFVISVAKQYQNRGVDLSDLINDGNLGLIKAAKRFDETRGFKFISYAVWWIRQSIIESISNHSRIVRLPLNKVGVVTKYSKAVSKLEQVLERLPTTEEVAVHMDVDEKELSAIDSHMLKYTSLDSKVFEDEGTTVADMTPDDSVAKPSDRLDNQSLSIDIARACEGLSANEQKILTYFFGLNKGREMTLEEISEKMHLSKERIRQLKAKAIRRLKAGERGKVLRKYLGD